MNRLKMTMRICVLATMVTTLLLTAKVIEAAPPTCGTWSVVTSPNAGSNGNYLTGVAAVSASNVWAVGTYFSNVSQTLIEHWNGTSWSVVSGPNAESDNNYLYGVARVPGSSKVWAAGDYRFSSIDNFQTLTEFYC